MKIHLLRRASKDLLVLNRIDRTRILAKLKTLEKPPFPANVKRLTGREDYRLRVGDYRILFKVVQGMIIVSRIAHRREVYR